MGFLGGVIYGTAMTVARAGRSAPSRDRKDAPAGHAHTTRAAQRAAAKAQQLEADLAAEYRAWSRTPLGMRWERERLLADMARISMRSRDEVWRAGWRQAARADGLATPSKQFTIGTYAAPAVRVTARLVRVVAAAAGVIVLLQTLGTGSDGATAIWALIGAVLASVALTAAAARLPQLDFVLEAAHDRRWARLRVEKYGFDPFDANATPPGYDQDGRAYPTQKRLEALLDTPFSGIAEPHIDELRLLTTPLPVRKDTAGMPSQVAQALTVIDDL